MSQQPPWDYPNEYVQENVHQHNQQWQGNRGCPPEWEAQGYSNRYPPQQYGQYPPGWTRQPYPPQQPARMVTKRGLGPFWNLFHLFMTCMTIGLWIPIWIWHSKSRNTVTTYR